MPTLSLSPTAKATWINFFNEVETGLTPLQGQWTEIKDFASKAAENVARLAALFHLFMGNDGDVLTESVEQAITIIKWHLEETRHLLAPFATEPQFADAEKLMNWLLSKQLRFTTPRTIQQSSPLRSRDRRDNALEVLIEHHWVRMVNRDNQTMIEVNPNVYLD